MGGEKYTVPELSQIHRLKKDMDICAVRRSIFFKNSQKASSVAVTL
jgi:hypothetical protein